MKLDEKTRKRVEPQQFSGKVEVSITGIDTKHRRMTSGYRKSFRVSETTVEEVFDAVYSAISAKANT